MSREVTEEDTTDQLLDYLGQDCEWAAEIVRKRLKALEGALLTEQQEVTNKQYEETCRQFESTVESLERELSTLRESMRWIPVSERLPEEENEYLIFDGAEIWHGSFAAGQFSELATSDPLFDVTHWMPIPQPPEQDTGK